MIELLNEAKDEKDHVVELKVNVKEEVKDANEKEEVVEDVNQEVVELELVLDFYKKNVLVMVDVVGVEILLEMDVI